MVQLELFDTDGLVPIRHFLTCWSEAERAHRLEQIKCPTYLASSRAKPPFDGGRKV